MPLHRFSQSLACRIGLWATPTLAETPSRPARKGLNAGTSTESLSHDGWYRDPPPDARDLRGHRKWQALSALNKAQARCPSDPVNVAWISITKANESEDARNCSGLSKPRSRIASVNAASTPKTLPCPPHPIHPPYPKSLRERGLPRNLWVTSMRSALGSPPEVGFFGASCNSHCKFPGSHFRHNPLPLCLYKLSPEGVYPQISVKRSIFKNRSVASDQKGHTIDPDFLSNRRIGFHGDLMLCDLELRL